MGFIHIYEEVIERMYVSSPEFLESWELTITPFFIDGVRFMVQAVFMNADRISPSCEDFIVSLQICC